MHEEQNIKIRKKEMRSGKKKKKKHLVPCFFLKRNLYSKTERWKETCEIIGF